ncbi:cyclopropane-fatty-acyl-phospholipid synthase family protein [Streptomyces sp. YS415]|uniref:SAM-dependent methyltransferase n=1 Tax=Streptomyces sp. YS415 TaxID=2944806 RepID=UPI002020A7EA|nr:cyclopropane-fatty-acyl-phospholipid synthase family protein [Streptomyces sp. YS415]MCL7430175.1 cyclopropane-fatty-acyl-phospholipid synthase family protein [Streptomyces sp. YS415]
MPETAGVLARYIEGMLGSPLPVRLRTWDGSESGPAGGPVLVLRTPRAVRRLLWQPDELGLARAWVAGELTVEGDLYTFLDRLSGALWESEEQQDDRPSPLTRLTAAVQGVMAGNPAALLRLLGGLPLPLPNPPEETGRRRGRAHTKGRDRTAVSHHYDVGNDFYRLVLGPSFVYSCAYWPQYTLHARGLDRPTPPTLEQAQHDKLDLVCRKLGLRPGQRLLDVGCGWGSMAMHAAAAYGVRVTGVTISVEQAELARKRVAEAGLGDLVEIRVQDYRDVTDGPYDAISSIGMAEHVGAEAYRTYAARLHGLLRPGGRLLNHQIARRPRRVEESYRLNGFIDRYVFPDGELSPVGSTVSLLEEAGFEVRDVEALREHYALTLRAWVTNLERDWAEAVRLVGAGRARVWRLYMAASAVGFERNNLGVNQVLAVRTAPSGGSGMPLVARVPVTVEG